jgi:hypothetical protein
LAVIFRSLSDDTDDDILSFSVPEPVEPKKPEPTRLGYRGVWAPEVSPLQPAVDFSPFTGRRASLEACSSRFVVPRAFVVPDLAEQTIATLCLVRYDLHRGQNDGRSSMTSEMTHSAMETMLSNDFPTEVPPNFCTTHGEVVSSELLLSRDAVEAVEEAPVGVDAPDRLSCILFDAICVSLGLVECVVVIARPRRCPRRYCAEQGFGF